MLEQWNELLSAEEIEQIHSTSIEVLRIVGVGFPYEEALAIFRTHGIRTERQTAYFTEDQVLAALESVPEQFTVQARDPAKSIVVGDGRPIFAPGAGAPFVVNADSSVREATLKDCHDLARLAHALPELDTLGHIMVMPSDVPAETAHLHALQASVLHSDKTFAGGVVNGQAAEHTMEVISILFGRQVEGQAVVVGGLNSLTPLRYGRDTLEALMVYAGWGQPVMIGAAAMAGATAPITLAGLLAVQNAELLAGIVLTQLIRSGTPVIYGSASGNLDMRAATLCIGSPEFSLLSSVHSQLARRYGIPSKAGGALTDSCYPDERAGFESMQGLLTAVNSGVDYVVHAAGILGSFKLFSYEKMMLDHEMCSMMRRLQQGVDVSSTELALDVITEVGSGGDYLTEMHTVDRCRTAFWMPWALQRQGLEEWVDGGRRQAVDQARDRWHTLLAGHQDPPLDSITARQLASFMEARIGSR